jgi:hypothetical protein
MDEERKKLFKNEISQNYLSEQKNRHLFDSILYGKFTKEHIEQKFEENLDILCDAEFEDMYDVYNQISNNLNNIFNHINNSDYEYTIKEEHKKYTDAYAKKHNKFYLMIFFDTFFDFYMNGETENNYDPLKWDKDHFNKLFIKRLDDVINTLK